MLVDKNRMPLLWQTAGGMQAIRESNALPATTTDPNAAALLAASGWNDGADQLQLASDANTWRDMLLVSLIGQCSTTNLLHLKKKA
jgi:hypothetical protein